MAFAPQLTTAMQSVSGFLQSSAETIKAAGRGDPEAQKKVAEAAVAAVAASPAIAATTQIAGQLATGVGLTSGMIGMMNPATRPLAAAGLTLLAAGQSLQA